MNRRRILLSLLALGAGLTSGCATFTRPWQAPEVSLVGVKPKSIALDRQTLTLRLAVRNPNDRALPIKAMTYRLKLDGREVAEGGGALERTIPALGEATVDVDVTASALQLLQQLPSLALSNRPVDWRVSGTATLAGGVVTLPYRYSGSIDPKTLRAGTW
jgi:LEA14-like dessication related protein